VLLKSLGMSAASISLLATVRVGSVALFSLLTGPLATPLRRPTLLAVAGLLGAAGMALIPALSGTGLSFLPMILFGLCGGAMHNVQMAVAGEAVAPADRALSMALVGSIGNVAMTATPLWHGWMANRGWLAEAFPWTGLILAAVVIVCFGWARSMARHARAADKPQEDLQP
jgi:MFS family permease